MKPSPMTTIATLALIAGLAVDGATPAAAQDAERGERVFKRCQACHSLDAGQHTDKGPSLHGIFGRRAGTAEGYAYSEAMKSADIVWDDGTLEAFLADAQAVVPGNTMNFSSLRKPDDRTAVIAYLHSVAE